MITKSISGLDWDRIDVEINEQGFALTPPIIPPDLCAGLVGMYEDDKLFRKRIIMERHQFGSGDYGYFADPLPALVQSIRSALYTHLAPIANRLNEGMRSDVRFPPTLDEFRAECSAAGQSQPTPLVLRYGAGGYNRLHRDLYGEISFPLQGTVMLNRPGQDFHGGQFLLVENRPRQQAIGSAVDIPFGALIIFATNERPVPGARTTFRASMRHGVSKVTAGQRYTLGIIFHDAA